MAPALAAINLAALKHSGTETEGAVLALGAALEKIEIELQYEAEAEELPLVKKKEDVVQGPSCSKIPFIEMLFHEAQRVDRRHLKLLLKYIGDLTRVFGGELEAKDREAATRSEDDGSEFDMTGSKFRGLRARSKLPGMWSEPKVIAKNFPGLD